MGAVATVLAVVVVVLVAKTVSGTAHARASSEPLVPPVPSATAAEATTSAPVPVSPQPSSAQPAVSAPPPATVTREVIVSVVPPDATVTQDGRDLGASPVVLQLAQGESANLIVTRKGYKTKTIPVDGTEPKVTVTLESAFAPAAGPRKSAGGLEDVGDPFAKKHR
jgi:hypothetical protein